MKARDLSELAGRNLREALLRNSLTTAGIAIGVASLVAMLSLGVGLQDLVGRRLERTGLFDSVLVRPQGGFGGPGPVTIASSGLDRLSAMMATSRMMRRLPLRCNRSMRPCASGSPRFRT